MDPVHLFFLIAGAVALGIVAASLTLFGILLAAEHFIRLKNGTIW
jgi:hypothetical protein